MADYPNGNGRWRVDPTVALQLIAYVVLTVLTYGAISSRVAVVESKQNDAERRMQRVEDKLDQLLYIANGR